MRSWRGCLKMPAGNGSTTARPKREDWRNETERYRIRHQSSGLRGKVHIGMAPAEQRRRIRASPGYEKLGAAISAVLLMLVQRASGAGITNRCCRLGDGRSSGRGCVRRVVRARACFPPWAAWLSVVPVAVLQGASNCRAWDILCCREVPPC